MEWNTVLGLCCLMAVLSLYPSILQQSGTSASGGPGGAAAYGSGSGASVELDLEAQVGFHDGGVPPFRPEGYELPTECAKHAPLYGTVLEDLRPWMARGITRADLDACAPVAEGNTSKYESGTPNGIRFRAFTSNNTVFITSGGIRRNTDGYGIQGLEYFQFRQIQDAARRFGLPDMEFAVGFGDVSLVKGEADGGLCPLMLYCKFASDFDIRIPDGNFIRFPLGEERLMPEDHGILRSGCSEHIMLPPPICPHETAEPQKAWERDAD